MTFGNLHGGGTISGTILGSITLAIMAVGQALKPRPRPQVDEVERRNPREDARTQNIWLFGA